MTNQLTRKLLILFMVLFCITVNASWANAEFTHPGLLNNMEELDLIHDKVSQQEEPWISSFNSIPNNLNYSPQAVVDYVDTCTWDRAINPHRWQLYEDSVAVYGVTLQWAATRDPIYAEKAIEILNAWANTMESASSQVVPPKTSCEGSRLYIGSYFPRFILAAEIIRGTYPGWNQTEQDQFTNFLVSLLYNSAQAIDHDTERAVGTNVGLSNWAAKGVLLRMSIAVYTDNQAYFDAAVADYQHLIGASFESDGRAMETCRGIGGGNNGLDYFGGGDMIHTHGSIAYLVAAAEIAKQQGVVDLYGYQDPFDGTSLLDALLFHEPFIGFSADSSGNFTGRGSNVTWPCDLALGEPEEDPEVWTEARGSNYWRMANHHYQHPALTQMLNEKNLLEGPASTGGYGELTHSDNNSAGVLIVKSGGSTDVTEGGSTDTYTVALTSQPTDAVVVTLTSADPVTGVTVGVPSLTFTPSPGDWDLPRTVTVAAVDDTAVEGTHSAVITHNIDQGLTLDTNYAALAGTLPDVLATITDNDTGGTLPAMTSPVPGSTLTTETVTFQWSLGVGWGEYFLGVATSQTALGTDPYGDIYNGYPVGTSQVVSNIPLTGNPVYVRLWYRVGPGNPWLTLDYTYQTGSALPAMTSPVPGSTLTTETVTFQWSLGVGWGEYFLGVATSQTALGTDPYGDIYNGYPVGTSQVVSNIPLTGNPVYVRLWYRVGPGNPWFSIDFSYSTSVGQSGG